MLNGRSRVPAHWYRERVLQACTAAVLKTGLTNTFGKTSMSKVANHPPRFRFVRFVLLRAQGELPANGE